MTLLSRMRPSPGMIAVCIIALVACGDADSSDSEAEVALDSVRGSMTGLERPWNIVELPDGRVAFSQTGTPALVVAELGAGSADTLGREGDGPGEYRGPTTVALLGGALAVFDYRNVHSDDYAAARAHSGGHQ